MQRLYRAGDYPVTKKLVHRRGSPSSTSKSILITGATGFLGRRLVAACYNRGYNVMAMGHTPNERLLAFSQALPRMNYYLADINKRSDLIQLFSYNKINYVIHAAAIKYVGLCEQNPSQAIQTNIVGSHNIVSLCQEFDVDNALLISTDKAVKSSSIYGTTKRMAELLFLDYHYSVFRGVNFLWSTGSVLDLWSQAVAKEQPLHLNEPDAIRYFCSVEDVISILLANLDSKANIFSVSKCYKIRMQDLAIAFMEEYDYNNIKSGSLSEGEKKEEELPLSAIEIIDVDIPSIKKILSCTKT
jgi:FlaA1/EpsC-like NDP-sugar epimerase